MASTTSLNNQLKKEIALVYNNSSLAFFNFKIHPESIAYKACQFSLNDALVIYREAKITPKKVGQFVTFWKRINGSTQPFNEEDTFDFFVVTVKANNKQGQFIFPKSILIKKGIISATGKAGKRGFRIYPSWDSTHSKQAISTQKWQLSYFHEIKDDNFTLNKIGSLFKNK